MPNYNPETGIPYGYISSRALDPDLVTNLLDGAGNLDDLNGDYTCYDVPSSWRNEDAGSE